MKNPITEMTGSEFLMFYMMVIALLYGFCRLRRKYSDDTASLPLPEIPDRVDPYEIACLRGGENELARVAIVQLTKLGYLSIETRKDKWWSTEQKRIVLSSGHPATSRLNALELSVFHWFEYGRTVEEVFANGELARLLKSHALHYEEKLQAQRLLASDDAKAQAQAG